MTLVHPKAVAAYDAELGEGTVVMAGAVVSEGVVIGRGCIINTKASIGCNTIVDDFAHISVGMQIGENVRIGAKAWTGIGARFVDGIDISAYGDNVRDDVIVGAGACVLEDITEAGVYVGAPAGRMGRR